MAPRTSQEGFRSSSSTQRSLIVGGVQSQHQQRQQQQCLEPEVRRQLLHAYTMSPGGSGGSSSNGTAAALTASGCLAACDQPGNRSVLLHQQRTRGNSCGGTVSKHLLKDGRRQGCPVTSCALLRQQQLHQPAHRPACGSRHPAAPSAAATAAAVARTPPSVTATPPMAVAISTAAVSAPAAVGTLGAKAAPATTPAPQAIAALSAVLARPPAAASAATQLLTGGRPVTAVWGQDESYGRRRVASAHAGGSAFRRGQLQGLHQQQQQRQQQAAESTSLLSRVEAWFAGGGADGATVTRKEISTRATASAPHRNAASHFLSKSLPRSKTTSSKSYPAGAVATAAAAAAHGLHVAAPLFSPKEAATVEPEGPLRLSSLPSGFMYTPVVPVPQQQWAPATGYPLLNAAVSSGPSMGSAAEVPGGAASVPSAAGYLADTPCTRSLYDVDVPRSEAVLQQMQTQVHPRLQQERQDEEEGQENEQQQQQRQQREQARLMKQFLQQQQERYATVRQASLLKDLRHGEGYVTFAHAAAAARSYNLYGASQVAVAARDHPASLKTSVYADSAAAAAAGKASERPAARETAGARLFVEIGVKGAAGEGRIVPDAGAEQAAALFRAVEGVVSAEEGKKAKEKTIELSGGEERDFLTCSLLDEEVAAAAAAGPTAAAGVQASSSSGTISSSDNSGQGMSNRRKMSQSISTGTMKTSRSIDGGSNNSKEKGTASNADCGRATASAEDCKESLERKEAEDKVAAATKVRSSGKKVAAAAACSGKTQNAATRGRGQQEDTQQQQQQQKEHGSKTRARQEQHLRVQKQQLPLSAPQESEKDAGVVLRQRLPDKQQQEHQRHPSHKQQDEEGEDKEQNEADASTKQAEEGHPAEDKQPAAQHQHELVEQQQEGSGRPQEASEQQQEAATEEEQTETTATEEETAPGKCRALETVVKGQEEGISLTTAAAAAEEAEGEGRVAATAAEAGKCRALETVVKGQEEALTTATAAAEEAEGEGRVAATAAGVAKKQIETTSGDAERGTAAMSIGYMTSAEGSRDAVAGAGGDAELSAERERAVATASAAGGREPEAAAATAGGDVRAGGTAATGEGAKDAAAGEDGASTAAGAVHNDDRNVSRKVETTENEEESVMLPFGQAYPQGLLKGCKVIYELDEEMQHERERMVQVLLIHDTPDVYLLPHLLTGAQCRHIIDLCASRWRKSRTSKGPADAPQSEYSSMESLKRTSQSARLRPAETPVVAAVEEVAAAFAGCSVACLEPLAVVKYEEGEDFKEHYDGAFRPVTLLIYLNDVEEGGETEFPYLHLKLTPTEGWGVMWRNAIPECQVSGNKSSCESSSSSGESSSGESSSSSSSRRMCMDPRVLHAGLPPRKGPKYVVNCFFNAKPIRQAIAQAEAAMAASAAAAHEKEVSQGATAGEKGGQLTPPEAAEEARAPTSSKEVSRGAFSVSRNITTVAPSEEGRRAVQQLGYGTCSSSETTTTSTVASTPSDCRQPSAAFLLRQQQQGGGLQRGHRAVQQQQLLQKNWNSCQSLCSPVEKPRRDAQGARSGLYAVQQRQEERRIPLTRSTGLKAAVAGRPAPALASGSSSADIRNYCCPAPAAARRTDLSGLQQRRQLPRQATQRHPAASAGRLTYGAAGSSPASATGPLSLSSVCLPSSSRAPGDTQIAGSQTINNSAYAMCSMRAGSRTQVSSNTITGTPEVPHAERKMTLSVSPNACREGLQSSLPAGSTCSNIQRMRVGQAASGVHAGKVLHPFRSSSSTYLQNGLSTGKSPATAPVSLGCKGGARTQRTPGYSAVGCQQQQANVEIPAMKDVRSSSLSRAGGIPAAAAAQYGGRSGSSIPLYSGLTAAGATTAAPTTAAHSIATGLGRGFDFFGAQGFLNPQLQAGGGGPQAFNPFSLQGNNNFFSSAPAFMMVFGPDGVPQMKPLTQQQIEEGVGKYLIHEAMKNLKR